MLFNLIAPCDRCLGLEPVNKTYDLSIGRGCSIANTIAYWPFFGSSDEAVSVAKELKGFRIEDGGTYLQLISPIIAWVFNKIPVNNKYLNPDYYILCLTYG